jgi:hypothetical protein
MADGSSSTFRVSFKEPLEIQQGEYYVASAKLKVIPISSTLMRSIDEHDSILS